MVAGKAPSGPRLPASPRLRRHPLWNWSTNRPRNMGGRVMGQGSVGSPGSDGALPYLHLLRDSGRPGSRTILREKSPDILAQDLVPGRTQMDLIADK
jgi:hypothetical protein